MKAYLHKKGEVAWSSELAYAIGLMASDGCLLNDGRHLDFTSKDVEQVKNISRCFDLAHIKIGLKNQGSVYRVQWGDVALYHFLLSIGLMPNKSKKLGALRIPEALFFDFLRGSFDGDGSFYSYFDPRWRSSFMYYLSFVSASSQHVLWIRETLERLIRVRGHITKNKKSSVVQLKYAKKEALQVLRMMYHVQGIPCLARKRLKIEEALRIVGESLFLRDKVRGKNAQVA